MTVKIGFDTGYTTRSCNGLAPLLPFAGVEAVPFGGAVFVDDQADLQSGGPHRQQPGGGLRLVAHKLPQRFEHGLVIGKDIFVGHNHASLIPVWLADERQQEAGRDTGIYPSPQCAHILLPKRDYHNSYKADNQVFDQQHPECGPASLPQW